MSQQQQQAVPEHNRFQRWYFAWAEPHYLRMEPPIQRQARAMDRFLYSRRGLGAWLGLGGTVAGLAVALRAGGLPLAAALALALLLVFGLICALMAAWLYPDKLAGRRGALRLVLQILLCALAGVALSWLALRLLAGGWPGREALLAELAQLLRVGVPVALAAGLVLALLIGLTAAARRHQLQQELAEARAAEERASAAREASEARLRLLQAQIQPHFMFNTLSAVQHWVDSGDARASALLRALTAFLRGSAELMLRPQVSLAEELALTEQYLRVMQARWGERLRYAVEAEAALAGAARLPPGILLSLVENALEHGLAPALAGGRLEIRLAALVGGGWRLEVADDGVGLAAGWREGLGLGNSRARLAHAFGARALLALQARPAGGTLATLQVEDRDGEAA